MKDRFTVPINVRYLEVDQQGVVFNMWYLAYVDDAMTEFMRFIGRRYEDLMSSGVDFQLVHASLDWRDGIAFGDEVAIAVDVEAVGNTSFTLAYEVQKSRRPAATAKAVYVCIGVDGSGKRPLPDELRNKLLAYAAEHGPRAQSPPE
jgi:acyl-CoA thioester hydrolase